MNIFITGASGLIGNQLLQLLVPLYKVVGSHISYPTPLTVYYNPSESNETNFDLDAFAPDIIIHCGALTHVDYCEQHEQESYDSTVVSTQKLLAIAQQHRAKFIYLSTDYVFDGTKGPYSEMDTPNPINIYGKHKLMAEQLVTSYSNHLILRVTNVYGDEPRNKNFIARIISQIKQNTPVSLSVPIDQFATPINAADVARATHELILSGETGIFHLSSYDYLSRSQLINVIKKHFPLASIHTEYKTTQELNQDAKRPLNGGLKNALFSQKFPNFTFTGVDDYLTSKK